MIYAERSIKAHADRKRSVGARTDAIIRTMSLYSGRSDRMCSRAPAFCLYRPLSIEFESFSFNKVWRPTGQSYGYQLVSSTVFYARIRGVNLIHVHQYFRIRYGDVIGFYFPGKAIIPFDGAGCSSHRGVYALKPTQSNLKIGAVTNFKPTDTCQLPCRRYSVAALTIPGILVQYVYVIILLNTTAVCFLVF